MKTTDPKNLNGELSQVVSQEDQQLTLDFSMNLDMADVPWSVIGVQPDFHHAILLCMQMSGLSDTDIGKALPLEKAQFSKFRSGGAHFPHNLLIRLMQICGNLAPLYWLVQRCGIDPLSMRPKRSELEARLEAKETELKAAKQETEMLFALLGRMKSAG